MMLFWLPVVGLWWLWFSASGLLAWLSKGGAKDSKTFGVCRCSPQIIKIFRVWIFEGTWGNLYHQSYQLLQYMSKCDDFQNETLWLLPFLPRLAWENSRSHSLLTLETNRSCVISCLWSVSCLLRIYRVATTSRGNRACNFLISNMIHKYILTWI